MKIHLDNAIAELKKNILELGEMVEEVVRSAAAAAINNDAALADKIIRYDKIIDRREIMIEEECLKILALHQPVATDLRYVVACAKVNNDMERICDLGVNIAKRAKALAESEHYSSKLDFNPMINVTRIMLKGALDALVYMDEKLARDVIAKDDIVDECNAKTFEMVKELIKNDPQHVEYYLNMLSISRYLERIADYTTNICEDIIYMIRGEIVRHSGL
jgi:phosphate transport system protein